MAITQANNKKYRFPWQNGNSFQLLIDGPEFFKSMLEDISGAEEYILLEMYLIQPGRVSGLFFTAMQQAVNRGVAVYMLMDDFGSRSIDEAIRQQLVDSGIHLAIYNPLHISKRALMLFRDHRKMMVVDGSVAYVGGAALTDDFDDAQSPNKTWRENMVRISGNNVGQWQALFLDIWQQWSDVSIILKPAVQVNANQTGRVTMTYGPYFLEIKRSFIRHIRQAKERVWLCTAYFAPSRKLVRALAKAAQNGKDVRLLLPGPITDHPMSRYLGQNSYARLLKSGVRIFEYQPRFMHAKLALCDDWVTIGSCNIDRWNLRWNLDANQEVSDSQFASQIANMFIADFKESEEVSLEYWQKRSWRVRSRIWFWAHYIRLADMLLTRMRILRYWREIRKQRKKRKTVLLPGQ